MTVQAVDTTVDILLVSRGPRSDKSASVHRSAFRSIQPVAVVGNPGDAGSLSLHAKPTMIHNPQAL